MKNYKPYSHVSDIYENGNYDCLTGTYFLSTSLTQLGVEYKIYETNYHVFLVAQTKKGKVLVESTDPENGFVLNEREIERRISKYKQSELSSDKAKLYLSKIHLFQELSNDQLPGLLYFNSAVEAFHKNKLDLSSIYLKRAWEIYDNPRIDEFTPILLRAIAASALDRDTKEKLITLLHSHEQSVYHSIASLN